MKKIILTTTMFICSCTLFGQIVVSESPKKEFKNIIGVDATGLIKQLLNFNFYSSPYQSEGIFYYNSIYYYPYMISYRRIFKSNTIRTGVGGYLLNNNNTVNDSLQSSYKSNAFNLALGFEHYTFLSKRFNFYFGADFVWNYELLESNYAYSQTQYNYDKTNTNKYGIAPLMGLVFNLNSRISIATETSYKISYITAIDKDKYVSGNYIDEDNRKIKGFEGQFYAPTSINLRILF